MLLNDAVIVDISYTNTFDNKKIYTNIIQVVSKYNWKVPQKKIYNKKVLLLSNFFYDVSTYVRIYDFIHSTLNLFH